MLDKEFTKLIGWRDKVFQIFLALLTAEAIMIYAIVSKEKPIYVLALVVVCIFLLVGIGLKLKSINEDIEIVIAVLVAGIVLYVINSGAKHIDAKC